MSVIEEIAAERKRQTEVEGWTTTHDDEEHSDGQLAVAAGCYAIHAGGRRDFRKRLSNTERLWDWLPRGWPWSAGWWKPKNPRRDLIRAGALIVAEIERLDRKESRK